MKTKEELNELKNEVLELNKKLSELSNEELGEITGGSDYYHKEIDNQLYYRDDYEGKYTGSDIFKFIISSDKDN